MSNENCQSPEDEYMLVPFDGDKKAKVHRDTFNVVGIYEGVTYTPANAVDPEVMLKAHTAIRLKTFDIVGEENKGA